MNYRKRHAIAGSGGIPDYTFLLPQGLSLHMDVKFPLNNYMRYLDATSDVERERYRAVDWRPICRVGRLNDDGSVQAHLLCEVLANMRVVPVEPRIGKLDLIGERAADRNGLLSLVRHTVESVFEPQTMPVHGRLHVAVVPHVYGNFRALIDVKCRTGN